MNRPLPVLPLRTAVLFPSHGMPLTVQRPRSLAALEMALASEDKNLIVASQKDPFTDVPGLKDLFPIATAAVVRRMYRTEQGVQAVVQGVTRVRLVGEVTPGARGNGSDDTTLLALAVPLADARDEGAEIEALHQETLLVAQRILDLTKPQGFSLSQLLGDISDPVYQMYLLATVFELDVQREQELLAAPSRRHALAAMHGYLTHELEVLTLRREIQSQAEERISRQQREYVLRQQLQTIQEELGGDNPEKLELEELRKSLEESGMPEAAYKEVSRELGRMERMPQGAEQQMIRSYIDFALELPWAKTTDDRLDLRHARQVLDADHFDLQEVKSRILEHLAVMKLNPKAKAPILCFVGPPGVGKTSLGQSIARAIGRTFERMSLGGLHDESELRGHRRTYIGSMPGRILQAIARAGVKNPLLMLDEIDKLGRDFRGDPSAALMEILDPAQNTDFRDNYLNLSFDLSQVFFITTANTLDTIPGPLLDRMEILRLSGYSDHEKMEIARRYLIPRQVSEAGLSPEDCQIPDDTLERIVRAYTREAGVRELERMLGRVVRKIATKYAERDSAERRPTRVEVSDLPELLGPERFFLSSARRDLGPGIAAGLAWTESGGDVLYVEAVLLPKSTELTLTGHLGKVMQESARAAQSYIQANASRLRLDPARIAESGVHIHIPSGAIPKDGPSAGVTMATALASLYTDRPVRQDTAMTGEITLSGLVLPVGGVKEKVLAAHRAGITRVLLPLENKKDLQELPDEIRDQVEFVFVESIADALRSAICGFDLG